MSVDCTHKQCRDTFECYLQTDLEIMIDKHGLDTVLSAIREICYAKANHIAVAEQNVAQAKLWLAKGIKINSAVHGFDNGVFR